MWVGKVLLIIFISLESGITQQSKEPEIDFEQFLNNIKSTIEKIIESPRKKRMSNKKKRDKVRKQLLKKLTYPHLSLFKPHSHYILNYNPPYKYESTSLTNTKFDSPPLNKVLKSMPFEDKVIATLKNNPLVFWGGLPELKKMFERIRQRIKSNISSISMAQKDKGEQHNISYADQYSNEVKHFMLKVLKALGSYWYIIKIMFVDNASFYEKWKKGLCPCIRSNIFTSYYNDFVFKSDIKGYSPAIHEPLNYTNISARCNHSICSGLKKLARLTADKKFSRYFLTISNCITPENIRKPICSLINVRMYQLYYRAILIFTEFEKILKEIILPSYISLLASPTAEETPEEKTISVLAVLQFQMVKERLTQIVIPFIILQQMLQKEERRYPSNTIINGYNCSKEVQELLSHPFNKFMVDYSLLVRKMESTLSTVLYELNETLKNYYIEYSTQTMGLQKQFIIKIIYLMSKIAEKQPKKLYEILFSQEFLKIMDGSRLEELFEIMKKGIIEKKSLCMLIAWGILLYNISIQNPLYRPSKELLSQYGLFDTSLVLGNDGTLLREYFEKFYKEGKLLNKLVDRVKKIQNEDETILYLSYLLSPPPFSRDPASIKPPPERDTSNHIVFIAHLSYIIYSIFSVLRTYKCLGIDDGNEYNTFVEQYKCLLEGESIDCLGGGFTYLARMLKSVSENRDEIYLSNYSEFSKKLGEIEIKDVGFVKSKCPRQESVCKVLDRKEVGNTKKEFCSAIIERDIYSGIFESCSVPFNRCADSECGGSDKPILCYYKRGGGLPSLSTQKCCMKCKKDGQVTMIDQDVCDCSAYTDTLQQQQCERCMAAGRVLISIFNIYKRIADFKDNIPQFCSDIEEDMKFTCCIPPACTTPQNLFYNFSFQLENTNKVIVEKDIFSNMKKYQNLFDYEKTIRCLLLEK